MRVPLLDPEAYSRLIYSKLEPPDYIVMICTADHGTTFELAVHIIKKYFNNSQGVDFCVLIYGVDDLIVFFKKARFSQIDLLHELREFRIKSPPISVESDIVIPTGPDGRPRERAWEIAEMLRKIHGIGKENEW